MSTEDNRFTARAARYARVGTNVGAVAAKVAAGRLFGRDLDNRSDAAALAAALGGLKGPLMKVAQLLSTIPEALPPEYARELAQLQSNAPPMGPAFVRRRLVAELGANWREKFGSFEEEAVASASLGQVHRATTHDGVPLAIKLQYPDMQSAVEADLNQLKVIFGMHARMGGAVDTREMLIEIGDRLREELDYRLEGRHARLYRYIFRDEPRVRVPDVFEDLSTNRMLAMGWLQGRKLLDYKSASMEDRNRLAEAMYQAWWYPVTHYGVIHGDPHLGNYTVFEEPGSAPADGSIGRPMGINLLDYGCIRKFPPTFVNGVIDLYNGLLRNDRAQVVHAYETWGFKGLSSDLIDALSIWAKFIYGPLLDDRERTIADGTAPGEYGRKEAFNVHQMLKEKGPVTIPREFVFMDRAAIGLGGVFLHLDARRNWHRMFNENIAGFDVATVTARQQQAFEVSGLADPLPPAPAAAAA